MILYKQLLQQCFADLPQPDILQIPWKFAAWDASFFEPCAQKVFFPSTSKNQIIMCDIDTFFKNYPEQAQKYLHGLAQKFSFEHQWNMYAHVYAQRQWVVYIPQGIRIQDACVLDLLEPCIEHITIIVEHDADVTLHEKMFSAKGKRIKNVDVILEQNAFLTFIAEHQDDTTMNVYLQYRFFVYDNAQLTCNIALLGGKNTMTMIDVYLCASGAQADIKGLYMLDDSRKSCVVTRQHHINKETLSNLVMKGIVRDQAHAVYHGTIAIAKNAPKTQAYQENKNIVLGDQAKVFSQPNLEIQTDDVRCKHATAIGKFDADQVLYMQSRGMAVEAIQQLLLEAFVADVVYPEMICPVRINIM